MLRLISQRCQAKKPHVMLQAICVQPATTEKRRAFSASAAAPAGIESALPTSLNHIWQSISSSTPVAYLQEGLIYAHDTSGLPWWCTIVLSTILLRTIITLPLTVYQQKISARLANLTLEMPKLQNELKLEVARAKKQFNWSEEKAKYMYYHTVNFVRMNEESGR